MQQPEFNKDLLHEFKRVYSLAGPHRIEKQTPYLAALAKHYEERAAVDPRKNWTDVLKAHTLYNSCAVRDPQEKWREDEFRVQQLYWSEDINISYQEQAEITESLKSELQSIRDTCRRCLKNLSGEVENWETDAKKLNQVGPDGICKETKSFVKKMEIVAKICNNKMVELARLCVEKAVSLCGDSPCKFAVVSLGSMARGEITPYSDWEFMFLVHKKSAKTVRYFELLAMTCYFVIGNLGETKLGCMNIIELNRWFEDKAQSGFKIDGLKDNAGNIPTGNGSPSQRNKFILTPEKLKELYTKVSEKPIRNEALKGDLTAMLASTKLVYGDENLLEEFTRFKAGHLPNTERREATTEMMMEDLSKYDISMRDSGVIDIKTEIFRYPTLFLLNLKIFYQLKSSYSWEVIDELNRKQILQPALESSLKFMLAAALYIRLSMYLHYNSQHDQLPRTEKEKVSASSKSWYFPFPLHFYLAMHTKAVQGNDADFIEDYFPYYLFLVVYANLSSKSMQGFEISPFKPMLILDNPLFKPVVLEPIRTAIQVFRQMGNFEKMNFYICLAMEEFEPDDVPRWLKISNIVMLNQTQQHLEVIKTADVYVKAFEDQMDEFHKFFREMLLSNSYLKVQNKEMCEYYANYYSTEIILESSVKLDEKILLLSYWATFNSLIKRRDEAVKMREKSLKLAESSNCNSCKLECSYQAMIQHFKKDMIVEATDAATTVMNLISKFDIHADQEMQMKFMWARVVCLAGYSDVAPEKDLHDALEAGYESLTMQRSISRDVNLAIATLRRLAIIHMKLEEYDKALLLLENAYRVIKLKLQHTPESSDWKAELEMCKTDTTSCLMLSGRMEQATVEYFEAMNARVTAEAANILASDWARTAISSMEINLPDDSSNEIASS